MLVHIIHHKKSTIISIYYFLLFAQIIYTHYRIRTDIPKRYRF